MSFRVMQWLTENGGGGRKQSDCTPGNYVLPNRMTVTDHSGGLSGGGEGASGCRSKAAVVRVRSGERGTKSVIRAGDGVLLVWTPRTWDEQMFPGGHFFSVLATGMVGGGPGWSISGGMAWGSSSRVSSGNEG